MLLRLLALSFPAKVPVLRPDADYPVWFCKPKRRVKGVVPGLDLTGMPAELPHLPHEQYDVLPELVGRLFDSEILSGDALRPLADEWCSFATRCPFRIARVVRPLRVAVETARAAAKVARMLERSADDFDRSTSSLVESTDVGSGSTEDSLSVAGSEP
jgi:hypothetical protein